MKIKKKIINLLVLSLELAKAEFKLRNEGSYLGVLWYLLNPLLSFSLLFLVFSDRLGGDIKNYSAYLFLGIIMFNFFQGTTLEAVKSIISENNHLVKSLNFPREALIISVVIKGLFSHLLEVCLFFIFSFFWAQNPFLIFFYLFLLILFVPFVYGVCLMLSSLTVYFVDLENIWNFAVRIIWLATPIFYAIESQTRLFYLNLANPMYYFIETARSVVIYGQLPRGWIIYGVVAFALLFLGAGQFVFGKLKTKIPELV